MKLEFKKQALAAVAAAAVCCSLLGGDRLVAETTELHLDPAQTQVEFTLADVLHTVHGTFRLKSGAIRFDPATGAASGAIVIDATSGNSGSKARDKRMHQNILESGKFPEITFTPKKVIGQLAAQGDSQVEVQGVFNLHGADHDMSMKVQVHQNGDHMTVATRFAVPYVQWGLKNPSTLFLRVSDKVDIDIRAAGRLTTTAS